VIQSLGMYRLISSSLLALMLISIVCAALGLIGYTPEGIAVTALIAVTITTLTSLMGAQTAKTIAHLESSVITGLLIAFIVPPTLELRDLLGVTAASAIAGLSKFGLVFRGRHVLNPAATGVFVAGILGLTAGFWWVANPILTPFIVLAGALVQWRSGLGLIALVGLFVGVATVLVRLVASGDEIIASIYLVFTSYPIVFLALFMLTEPLTMAPRRFAQILVAVTVGLGTALPFGFTLGFFTLSSSPELALVVGNLVAFGSTLTQRASRSASLSLCERSEFGRSGLLLRFALDKPLSFQAGQWVDIHVAHRGSDRRGQRRVFSVVSAPDQAMGPEPFIEVATTLADPGSSFKHALSQAPVTSQCQLRNLGGDFLLPKNPKTPVVMIAGGIGITPFVSQISHLSHRDEKRDITLLEVRSAGADHPFDEVLTEAKVSLVRVTRDQVEVALDRLSDKLRVGVCMVSGSPGFIKTVSKLLRKRGVRSFRTDSFIGY